MIRSPCMSRMSKNAVRTNTRPAAHRNITPVAQVTSTLTAKEGSTAVTMPHAMAISSVFDPGMSREDKLERALEWWNDSQFHLLFAVRSPELGFGDMYANAQSLVRGLFGHTLLAFQVILGYVLLGALITRFAVLFTAGGPAGKFADDKRQKTEDR